MNLAPLELDELLPTLSQNVHVMLLFIGSLWVIQMVNAVLSYRLNYLGIIPRNPMGISGIFFAPFLHGNTNHLFFNCIPLFVLGNFVLLFGLQAFLYLTAYIVIVSGILTWLFARNGLHVGASGLIMGYIGFLLMNTYWQSTLFTIILSIIILYYFGSMLLSIVPTRKQISWEGHLFGLIAGVTSVVLRTVI